MKRRIYSLLLTLFTVALLFTVFAVTTSAVETTEPTVSIERYNLTFKDNVYLKYAVKFSGVADSSLNKSNIGMLLYTSPKSEYTKENAVYSVAVTGSTKIDGVKHYTFVNDKFTAKTMTEYVYAVAYLDYNGETYYSAPSKYSVLEYAYSKLGKTGVASDDQNFINLLNATLYQGAMAQIYFGYNTDRLANDNYFKVSVEGGLLEDGFTTGLYHTGEVATLTAPETKDGISFSSWTDAKGKFVSSENPLVISTFDAHGTYLASYGHIHTPAADVVRENVIDPTCTEPGSYDEVVYCSECCAELSRENITTTLLGHDFTFATCTTPEICAYCGIMVGEPLGHDYVDDVCTRCGEAESHYHDWADATCHSPKTCRTCGQTVGVPNGHVAILLEKVEPTCTDWGLTEGKECAVCREILLFQERVAALGHDWADATCHSPKTCRRCGQTNGVAAGHSFVIDKAVEPTCTDWGLTEGSHCSVCEMIYEGQANIPPLGHSFTNYVYNGDATCFADGTESATCDRCADTTDIRTKTGSKLPHLNDIVLPSIAPTCTEDGRTEGRQCSACGAITIPQLVLPAPGHSFEGAGKFPTCTEPGYSSGGHCTVCDFVSTDKFFPATGHNMQFIPAMGATTPIAPTVRGENRVEPDCTNNGSYDTVTYCTTCNEELLRVTTTLEKLGHNIVVDAYLAPTCTTTGLTQGQHCSRCNDMTIAQQPIEELGRKFLVENYVSDGNATCLADGTKTAKCTRCDVTDTQKDVGSALGHNYTNYIYNGDATCFADGTESATCDRCAAATDIRTKTGSKLPHLNDIVLPSVAPGCTVDGKTEGRRCSACGAITMPQLVLPAPGHSFEGAGKLPTCTEPGYSVGGHCSVCGIVAEGAEYPANGHNMQFVPAIGATTPVAPTVKVENRVEPDCTNNGSYETVTYCSICNEELSRVKSTIDKLGHNIVVDEKVEPTCTATGLTAGKHCSVCDTVILAQEVVPANGHKFEGAGKLPTCTEPGYSVGGHCSVCGIVAEGAEYPANGHNMQFVPAIGATTPIAPTVKVENRVEPDCTHYGSYETVTYCTTCNVELSRVQSTIDKLGHNIVVDEKIEPTCIATGLTKGQHCTRCDEMTIEQEIIPVIAHEYLAENYKSDNNATCTTDGTKTAVCSRSDCYETDTVLDVDSALGHNYITGKCTRCGDEKYSEGLEFTSNGDGTCFVSGIGSCTDTDLIIPPTSPTGDKVTSIGDDAFADCNSLTSVVIPDSVTSIGYATFADCTSLTSVEIPDSVTSIGDAAFSWCTSLTSVVIGDRVTSIGVFAFSSCDRLTSIEVDENNQYYKDIDGNLYSKDATTLIQYATGKQDTSFTIPDSVTSIGNYAFFYCDSLTSVVIPDSVTSIDNYAFDGCYSLTSVVIGDSVTNIGDGAFYECESLTSVVIGDSVTSIGEGAFYSCYSLTSVVIGDSVISIGNSAFYYCTSLMSVVIPDSVTSIGSSAFSYCSSLTSIEVDENNQYYKDIDGNLYSKDGKTLIQYAIGKKDTSFTIPDSVTSIGNYAFAWCDSLTSVVIPDSVTSIVNYAFACCDSLTIYCEAESQPVGWNSSWNPSNRPVVWGYCAHISAEAVEENSVAPSCTVDGSYDAVVYCSKCGKELSRETITVSALGHNYENGVCTICGDISVSVKEHDSPIIVYNPNNESDES